MHRPAGFVVRRRPGEEDALAVDRDLDLMRMLEPANRLEVGAKQREREVVLAVEREVVADADAADRAERQALRGAELCD